MALSSSREQVRLTASNSSGSDAHANHLLQALLVQQQQHLQQQMRHLLDHHNAAILNMLEENYGSLQAAAGENANFTSASADDVAAATATEAAAAKTSSGTTHSSSTAPEHAQKPKHFQMASLTEEITDEPASSSMKDALSHFMQGRIATGIIGVVILANTVVMYVQLQFLGSKANASLELYDNVDMWGSANEVFRAFEVVFGVFFLLEFLLNVYAFRLEYFQSAFNVVDTIVVLLTSVETFLLHMLTLDVGNVSYLRILRLAKFAKALRVVRTMTLFSKLRILLVTIYYSMGALFWSMVLMFLSMLMGATFLCQMLHDFVMDQEADLATRIWVNERFGSGNKAFYSFFEMTFSGGWPNNASRVVKEVNPFYSIFFAVYVTFVVFGLIRIIGALFLSETLQQANHDRDIMVRHQTQRSKRFKRELGELFDIADTSDDGVLSLQELNGLLMHTKVQSWLAELGIDASDTQMLFDLLDDGDGQIDKEEFISGLSKIKGEARSQDLVPMAANCQRILAHCKVMRHTVETMASDMGIAAPGEQLGYESAAKRRRRQRRQQESPAGVDASAIAGSVA